MILVKLLGKNAQGKEFAKWQCGKCNAEMILGREIGRNRGECYVCEQKTRQHESYHAVYTPKSDNKERTCLMCNKNFKSMGSFNRRCPKCEPKAYFIEKYHSVKNANKTTDGRALKVKMEEPSDEENIRLILYGVPTEREIKC